MAIDPSTEYSGQVDADADYPWGKARNRSAPGSTDGTPLEKLWLNDLFGFFQAILDADDATPSGTPDSGAYSQYLIGLRRLKTGRQFGVYDGAEIRVFTGGAIIVNFGAGATIAGEINISDGGVQNVQDGGTVNLANGSNVAAYGGSTVTWKTGSQATQDAGAAAALNGTSTVGATGTLAVASGGHATFADGAVLTLNGGDNYPQLSSRAEWLPCNGMIFAAYDSQWTNYDGIGLQTAVATAQTAFQRETIPEHYTISKVQVRWKGPTHPTWPPENRTVFSVYKVDDGVKTLLATAEDTSDKATYESYHPLTIETGPFSETFTAGEFMLIEMVTESGTNAQIGSIWLSSEKYATFTELRNI